MNLPNGVYADGRDERKERVVKLKVRCDDCEATFTEVYPDGLSGEESYSDPEDPKPCDCDSQYTIIDEQEES